MRNNGPTKRFLRELEVARDRGMPFLVVVRRGETANIFGFKRTSIANRLNVFFQGGKGRTNQFYDTFSLTDPAIIESRL